MADHCRDNAVDLLVELDRPGEAADLMLASLDDDDLDQLHADRVSPVGRQPAGSGAPGRQSGASRRCPTRSGAAPSGLICCRRPAIIPKPRSEFRSLLKKNPTEIDFKLSLAWALSRMGDLDEARRWLDRAWEPVAADAGVAQRRQVCGDRGADRARGRQPSCRPGVVGADRRSRCKRVRSTCGCSASPFDRRRIGATGSAR